MVELNFGDWNTDTQDSTNIAIDGDTFGTTQTSGLESVLGGFVGDYSTDNKPARGLESRGEVK